MNDFIYISNRYIIFILHLSCYVYFNNFIVVRDELIRGGDANEAARRLRMLSRRVGGGEKR